MDLAEREFVQVGRLDEREITTSLGKRLLMILSPFGAWLSKQSVRSELTCAVFVQTTPISPTPELQSASLLHLFDETQPDFTERGLLTALDSTVIPHPAILSRPLESHFDRYQLSFEPAQSARSVGPTRSRRHHGVGTKQSWIPGMRIVWTTDVVDSAVYCYRMSQTSLPRDSIQRRNSSSRPKAVEAGGTKRMERDYCVCGASAWA